MFLSIIFINFININVYIQIYVHAHVRRRVQDVLKMY